MFINSSSCDNSFCKITEILQTFKISDFKLLEDFKIHVVWKKLVVGNIHEKKICGKKFSS